MDREGRQDDTQPSPPRGLREGSGGEQRRELPRRGLSRRRFGRLALTGAPVLITLPGGALRAATGGGQCTPSGWASGNTSRHPEWECGGRSPGYWGNPGGGAGSLSWEAHHDEMFFSAYGFDPGLSHSAFDGLTLWEVINLRGGHSARFGRFAVTALLNAKYIAAYDLSEALVREIVETTIRNGVYVTSTGDVLSEEEVATFLESTWDSVYFGAWLTPNG